MTSPDAGRATDSDGARADLSARNPVLLRRIYETMVLEARKRAPIRARSSR
ncbi:MAG TPA: hypothetical protein VII33_10185 [Nakamurella sp.]